MRNFGATYVDSARKLTWGTERLVYVLRPLLPDSEIKKLGLESIVKKCDLWSKDAHKTGPLEVYNTYHKLLKYGINKLSGKDTLLTTALSVDLTEPDPSKDVFPTRSCLDFAAHNNRLTDEQMIAEMQLNEEYAENNGWHNCFENLVKVSVGPFIMPYETKYDENKNPFIQHALPDIVTLTNEYMESKGKKGLGTLVKKLGDNSPQEGTYNFSELLFVPGKANHAFHHYDVDFIKRSMILLPDDIKEKIEKKFDLENMEYMKPPEELVKIFNLYYCSIIKQSTLINRKLAALALEESVLKPLGLKRLVVFASETSYVNSILHYLDGDYNRPRIKVMENVDRSPYGECDKSAMNRYKGLLMEYFAK